MYGINKRDEYSEPINETMNIQKPILTYLHFFFFPKLHSDHKMFILLLIITNDLKKSHPTK